jgi:hypothetical protein
MPKNSQSMDESIENGVFKFPLTVNKRIVRTGNNKTDSIEQIWVENMWMYNNHGDIIKDSNFQELILLRSLSKNDDMRIQLKNSQGYFGWNGVLDQWYLRSQDTVYICLKDGEKEQILDTIYVNK